jgi:hypothetical protein
MEAMDLALVTLPVGALSAGCVMLGNNTFCVAREDGGACRFTIACSESSCGKHRVGLRSKLQGGHRGKGWDLEPSKS